MLTLILVSSWYFMARFHEALYSAGTLFSP